MVISSTRLQHLNIHKANSFTMLLQIPTSIRSDNTLPTPCTLLLGKKLDIVDSRSQHGSTMNVVRQQLRRTTHTMPHCSQLQLFTSSTAKRGDKNATCFAGRSMNLQNRSAMKLRCMAAGIMLGNSFRRLSVCLKVSSLKLLSARTKMVIW